MSVETKWSLCDFALAPFRYDFNPAHQMLLALCDSLAPSEGPKATVLWRLCNLREEQLITGGMGFICTEMHCRSRATLYQSEFSVALQMCVRDSFLYLSTSLSYRATERLPNLAHRALPFCFPAVWTPLMTARESCLCFFVFVLCLFDFWCLGCITYSPTEVLAAQGDRICLRCYFAEQESAALIKLVTVCLHKKGMSLWFYFPETIMTTLWSTSNALSLHSWFIWFAFETSFWSLCDSGLAHCGAQLRRPECSCEPPWRKLHIWEQNQARL